MKITEKKKPIDTIPKGVWESSRPVRDKEGNKGNDTDPTTDWQENGYPVGKQEKKDM